MGQSAGVASYHPGYTRPIDPPPVKNRGSTDLADWPASQDLRAWTLGRPASSYLKHLELALLELVQAMLERKTKRRGGAGGWVFFSVLTTKQCHFHSFFPFPFFSVSIFFPFFSVFFSFSVSIFKFSFPFPFPFSFKKILWLAFETEMLTYPMENLTFEQPGKPGQNMINKRRGLCR